MAQDTIQRVAAKAIISNSQGKILILREAGTYEEGTNRGRYDVPGGRLDYGESFFVALKREVKEETGLDIVIGSPLVVGEWSPVIKGQVQQIVAVFMACSAIGDRIQLSNDHDEYRWITREDMRRYSILSAAVQAIEAGFAAKL